MIHNDWRTEVLPSTLHPITNLCSNEFGHETIQLFIYFCNTRPQQNSVQEMDHTNFSRKKKRKPVQLLSNTKRIFIEISLLPFEPYMHFKHVSCTDWSSPFAVK